MTGRDFRAVSGEVERQACGAGVDDDHTDVHAYTSGYTDQVSLFWILSHNSCQRGIGNVDQCIEHSGCDIDNCGEDHASCTIAHIDKGQDCEYCEEGASECDVGTEATES